MVFRVIDPFYRRTLSITNLVIIIIFTKILTFQIKFDINKISVTFYSHVKLDLYIIPLVKFLYGPEV